MVFVLSKRTPIFGVLQTLSAGLASGHGRRAEFTTVKVLVRKSMVMGRYGAACFEANHRSM